MSDFHSVRASSNNVVTVDAQLKLCIWAELCEGSVSVCALRCSKALFKFLKISNSFCISFPCTNHAGKPGCNTCKRLRRLNALSKFQQTSILPHAALSVSKGIIAIALSQSAAVSSLLCAKTRPLAFHWSKKESNNNQRVQWGALALTSFQYTR